MPVALIAIALIYGLVLLLKAITTMGIANALIIFAVFTLVIVVDIIVERVKDKLKKK